MEPVATKTASSPTSSAWTHSWPEYSPRITKPVENYDKSHLKLCSSLGTINPFVACHLSSANGIPKHEHQMSNPAILPISALHAISKTHPYYWDTSDVAKWLKWCTDEYSLVGVESDKFALNGKALCILKKDGFLQRCPTAGDILFENFQCLLQQAQQSLIPTGFNNPLLLFPNHSYSPPFQNCHSSFPLDYSNIYCKNDKMVDQPPLPNSYHQLQAFKQPMSLPTPPITPKEKFTFHTPFSSNLKNEPSSPSDSSKSESGHSDSEIEEDPDVGNGKPLRQDSRLLWAFIYQLLEQDKKYSQVIRWIDRPNRIFRICDPSSVAQLWGRLKNRNNMTYEKMSRALRYYYKMNIITKEPGRKLTYRFICNPNELSKNSRGRKPSSRTLSEHHACHHGLPMDRMMLVSPVTISPPLSPGQ